MAYERVHSRGADHHLRQSGDLISSLPDEILQQILSLIRTKFAIRTSILSKRWRHVWLDTPSLSFDSFSLKAHTINQTLARYTARKMKTFHICTRMRQNVPYIDTWIKFAMSRNVENLTLRFDHLPSSNMPEFFYNNSSLSDECTTTILSCCPILESVTLDSCDQLNVLDLSKSQHLTTLEIDRSLGPTQITSLCLFKNLKSEDILVVLLKMLEKLRDVEKLTFSAKFLQTLSLALALGRCPFPSVKVNDLTLETTLSSVEFPGIEKLLQNSPGVKKLTLHLCPFYFQNIDYQNLESEHVVSFIKVLLKFTKTLEKVVVRLACYIDGRGFEELLGMVSMLSHEYNVSIVLSSTCRIRGRSLECY
ncbi:BnaCnng37120D [Brassica napus]|uniref:BnaCnng37120D protein n=1 Tax=Brassica napus TaxID=3708 RepID=A0A078J474_BRANA|nr:BnaCnng37120D [Brassica napus]